jgi:hypothetical protein
LRCDRSEPGHEARHHQYDEDSDEAAQVKRDDAAQYS